LPSACAPETPYIFRHKGVSRGGLYAARYKHSRTFPKVSTANMFLSGSGKLDFLSQGRPYKALFKDILLSPGGSTF
jgi:hypothetical protein